MWVKGIVIKPADTPRSQYVKLENGTVLRRNNVHLKHSKTGNMLQNSEAFYDFDEEQNPVEPPPIVPPVVNTPPRNVPLSPENVPPVNPVRPQRKP